MTYGELQRLMGPSHDHVAVTSRRPSAFGLFHLPPPDGRLEKYRFMSRLSSLLRQVEKQDPQLAADLKREVDALSGRRAFGLNFERHIPETVELPNRPVRRGDKVRFLPERGANPNGVDQGLWRVARIRRTNDGRVADLLRHQNSEAEPYTTSRAVDDLVVVAEFRDPIYPGLVSTGKVARGGDKPFHTVINAENFHALQVLLYTHEGKVDAIYIDPPYNTGARDWKYNNDYVEAEDSYRHSKWLAMIERRLLIARRLLNPTASVLIVTIDEKEFLRLGLLLEQIFPEATIQMVSSVINPKGTGRWNEFSRTDEYIFFALFGAAAVPDKRGDGNEVEVRWRYLRRTDLESVRGTIKGGKAQFYPIYVDDANCTIAKIGEPLPHDQDRATSPDLIGCTKVFPIRESDGMEMNWGLTGPSLKNALEKGFVRVSANRNSEFQSYIFSYLTAPKIKKIEQGFLIKAGKRSDGSWIVINPEGKSSRPTTSWSEKSHEAGAHGTGILRALLPGRRFPFPKSLYAVEDCLRLFVGDKPNAIVLDFFSGSGTTAHAVMRVNRQDGGRRQCISVTNNEVGADEHRVLRRAGLRPGDTDWEQQGICDYVTRPRITAAITGRTPEGKEIEGDYKFIDEFPITEGFEANVEFFTMTYEAPRPVAHNRAFKAVAPLLWLRAGSHGRRIAEASYDFEVADTYAVLFDLDASQDFLTGIAAAASVRVAFIVTDDDRAFQMVCSELPARVEAIRLYESYLTNFTINTGRE